MPATVIDWMEGAQWPETLPVELDVDAAGRGRLQVNLRIDAQARLPCQRCGELLDWSAHIEQQVRLVPEEDLKQEAVQWVVDDERVILEELIAQEISLAMPDFPRHAECDLQ